MRLSTLQERKEFYENEFDVNKVEEFFKKYPKLPEFYIIIGRHTHIFLKEFENIKDIPIHLQNIEKISDLRNKLLNYLPESVYYSRIFVKSYEICKNCFINLKKCANCSNFIGYELMIDIDPENFKTLFFGSLLDRIRKGIYGLSFNYRLFLKAKKETKDIYSYLKKKFNFKKLTIVFSGRGFHIHVMDKLFKDYNEIIEIVDSLREYGFIFDYWVANGRDYLARLPYSLNSITSRIVKPISIEEIDEFDPRYDLNVIPKFLKNNKK